MKRYTALFAVVLILALSVVPAFATSGEEPVEDSTTNITTPVYVTVEDVVPSISVNDVVSVISPVRTALVDAITALFGEYTPRTYTVTTYLSDGTSVQSVEYVPGLAGLDWAWLSGVALFTLSLFCIFRMIGGFLKWV